LRIAISRQRLIVIVLLAWALFADRIRIQSQERDVHPLAIIGIASEIAPVEARLEGATVTRVQGIVFTLGTIDGERIVVARSGAGKVEAAIVATLLVDHFSPSAVVLTGTAGAIDTTLNPGDVVIGNAVGYHDFGDSSPSGFVRSPTRNGSSGRLDPPFFPADQALLTAARRAAATVKLSTLPNDSTGVSPRISEGRIVTGDAFVANPARRADLRRELNASAVEMEGAAVAQVCARFGVPTIIIRGITDHADESAANSYQRFVGLASRNAAELVFATIHEIRK